MRTFAKPIIQRDENVTAVVKAFANWGEDPRQIDVLGIFDFCQQMFGWSGSKATSRFHSKLLPAMRMFEVRIAACEFLSRTPSTMDKRTSSRDLTSFWRATKSGLESSELKQHKQQPGNEEETLIAEIQRRRVKYGVEEMRIRWGDGMAKRVGKKIPSMLERCAVSDPCAEFDDDAEEVSEHEEEKNQQDVLWEWAEMAIVEAVAPKLLSEFLEFDRNKEAEKARRSEMRRNKRGKVEEAGNARGQMKLSAFWDMSRVGM